MFNLCLSNVIIFSGVKMNIYDFDGTIYDGDSSVDFFIYCIKKNKKCLILFPKIFISLLLYLIKIKPKEYFKSAFFSFIKYFSNIEEVTEDFWKINIKKIKPFYIESKESTDIIISASPEFLLLPVSKKLNFKLIASKVDLKTGKFLGKNCYGLQKVERLKDLNITSCKKFFSDSLSDAPLTELADYSYIVKGNTITKWPS